MGAATHPRPQGQGPLRLHTPGQLRENIPAAVIAARLAHMAAASRSDGLGTLSEDQRCTPPPTQAGLPSHLINSQIGRASCRERV